MIRNGTIRYNTIGYDLISQEPRTRIHQGTQDIYNQPWHVLLRYLDVFFCFVNVKTRTYMPCLGLDVLLGEVTSVSM